MKPFQIFFKIDGYQNECLVIEENEEKAIEYLKQNYLGVENESITVFKVENRMIVEMNMF